MCRCVCFCIYACSHVCVCLCLCVCMHAGVHVNVGMCIYACSWVCVQAHTYTYLCTHIIHTCTVAGMHYTTFLHVFKHTMYSYTQTFMHIHMCIQIHSTVEQTADSSCAINFNYLITLIKSNINRYTITFNRLFTCTLLSI